VGKTKAPAKLIVGKGTYIQKDWEESKIE
jgi:hypothetical protein